MEENENGTELEAPRQITVSAVLTKKDRTVVDLGVIGQGDLHMKPGIIPEEES